MSADLLDSNILVYLFDSRDARKRDIAQRIVESGLRGGTAVISHQVVQETLNVLLRHASREESQHEAGQLLRDVLLPLWRLNPTPALYERALGLQERYRYSFYDSLIIAAALEGGCDRLLSEDLQHGQRIEGLVVENPFLA